MSASVRSSVAAALYAGMTAMTRSRRRGTGAGIVCRGVLNAFDRTGQPRRSQGNGSECSVPAEDRERVRPQIALEHALPERQLGRLGEAALEGQNRMVRGEQDL